MKKYIIFLKYLSSENGDLGSIVVNKKLNHLGLVTNASMHSFLESLQSKSLIFYRYKHLSSTKFTSRDLLGLSPEENLPIEYTANITMEGLQFLREDNFKYKNNWTTVGSLIVAFLAAVISVYFGIAAQNKEDQIEQLQQSMHLLNEKFNKVNVDNKQLKLELFVTKQSSKLQTEKSELVKRK